MTERGSNPQETEYHASFNYGRDLYIKLLQDDTPLVNLGYTAEQRVLARRALSHLEDEEARLSPGYMGGFYYPNTVVFGLNNFGDFGVRLMQLQGGGYDLQAEMDTIIEPEIFEDNPRLLARIDMIPDNVMYEDLDTLVQKLYGRDDPRVKGMRRSHLLSRILSHFTPVATYRAAWVDEDTKLELVVEHNYWGVQVHEEAGFWPDTELDTWRRLPPIKLDGKRWVPFGMKPDTSKRAAQKAPEEAKGKVRQFATDESQV